MTMQQMEILTESFKFLFIIGFIFFMVQIILNHSMKKKGILLKDNNLKNFYFLKKRLSIGLVILLFCFLGVIMAMNFFNNSISFDKNDILISSSPRLMKEAMNKVLDVVKLLAIFCFIAIGTKMILNYREKIAELNNKNQENENGKG